jgi:ferrous iron transport protein B
MQCLPTLAITRRETGRLRYAGLQLAYMSGVAYAAALVTYQGLRAMGIA